MMIMRILICITMMLMMPFMRWLSVVGQSIHFLTSFSDYHDEYLDQDYKDHDDYDEDNTIMVIIIMMHLPKDH